MCTGNICCCCCCCWNTAVAALEAATVRAHLAEGFDSAGIAPSSYVHLCIACRVPGHCRLTTGWQHVHSFAQAHPVAVLVLLGGCCRWLSRVLDVGACWVFVHATSCEAQRLNSQPLRLSSAAHLTAAFSAAACCLVGHSNHFPAGNCQLALNTGGVSSLPWQASPAIPAARVGAGHQ